MRLNPCHGCPARDGCEQREVYRAAVAGIGARNVSFTCAVLAARMKPGTRITISTPTVTFGGYRHYTDEPIERWGVKDVAATILATRPDHKFSCVVDPGELDAECVAEDKDVNRLRFRKMRPHTRIKAFRDEPPLKVCEGGNVLRDGACDRRDEWCCRVTPQDDGGWA